MIKVISDNIVSSLGFTTDENFESIKSGISGLKAITDSYYAKDQLIASVIDNKRLDLEFLNCVSMMGNNINNFSNYTKLEKAAIVSVAKSLEHCTVNPSSDQTLFIVSTTKGNIFLLDNIFQINKTQVSNIDLRLFLWKSAESISTFFKNNNKPIVASNACISGASALIMAHRELQSKRYENVIVVGIDILSKFIISGFQSFKALSNDYCKPFDVNHSGLNIGEGASTIILSSTTNCDNKDDVFFTNYAVNNDANHISGPSRTGEGSFLALKKVMRKTNTEEIAFINAHGTGTPYNDNMETMSLSRACLQTIPINSLKGYFGHTLGSAGILESIISIHELRKGIIIKTLGFEMPEANCNLNIVKTSQKTSKRTFVKMLSGFGGCNAVLLFSMF